MNVLLLFVVFMTFINLNFSPIFFFMVMSMAPLLKIVMTPHNLINFLLSFELMMMINLSIMLMSNEINSNSVMYITFFLIMVCEAIMGVGVMIYMSRKKGNDLL